MDKIDTLILRLLQHNADLTIDEISKAVNLSSTPCWNRINRLRNAGYIKNTVALLDHKKVGLGVMVFVFIKFDIHSRDDLLEFESKVNTMPQIIECHRMSGDIDYLLKVVIQDIDNFDVFYKEFTTNVRCKPTSSFVIEKVKYTNELPI